ncbi:MAG: hypothetical protein R2764_05955 [Bacteroidales bacterium]
MYHKVEDFANRKKTFDSFTEIRKSSGERSFSVGIINNEPNTAYVVNECESIKAPKAFLNNPKLGDAMKTA